MFSVGTMRTCHYIRNIRLKPRTTLPLRPIPTAQDKKARQTIICIVYSAWGARQKGEASYRECICRCIRQKQRHIYCVHTMGSGSHALPVWLWYASRREDVHLALLEVTQNAPLVCIACCFRVNGTRGQDKCPMHHAYVSHVWVSLALFLAFHPYVHVKRGLYCFIL